MKPKVIFLDFDGVLTSARIHVAYGGGDIWRVFDPAAIRFLSSLSDVEFVISSTWRLLFERQDFIHMFAAAGWNVNLHQIWCTPHPSTISITDENQALGSRAREILAWIENHLGERDFIVIDDDRGTFPADWKVVQTDPAEGMLWQHYGDVSALLTKGRIFNRRGR